MGRKKKWPPTLHRHRSSERAYVRIDNHDHYLGPWDVVRDEPSLEARAAYARLVARLAAGQVPTPAHAAEVTTVEDVAAAWMEAEAPRMSAKQRKLVMLSLRPLLRLYGPTDAAKFDAAALESLQLACATGSWLTEEEKKPRPGHWHPASDWCANVVNQRIGYVRSVWQWAERHNLVPKGSWAHLRTVPGLRKGDRRVRHTARRRPATWDEVRAVARHAKPLVRDALLLCWWTGMRPAEAYTMTPAELDRSGDVWVYRPGKHKGSHLDRTRQVAIGPRGQAILRPWLSDAARTLHSDVGRCPDAPIFRPVGRPGQTPAASYNEDSFSKAVGVAAKRAGLKGVTAYMLRHAFKKRIAKVFGLNGARTMMGHSSVSMTAEYSAEVDLEQAKEIAREQG